MLLRVNLTSIKSHSRDTFGQNLTLFPFFHSAQIGLIIGTVITGIVFHHCPIRSFSFNYFEDSVTNNLIMSCRACGVKLAASTVTLNFIHF